MLALHPVVLSVWLLRLASTRWLSHESILPFFAISPAPVNCADAIESEYENHPLAFYPPLACAVTKLERELEAQSRPRLVFYRAYRSWSPSSIIRRRTREASSVLISTLPNYVSIARGTFYRMVRARQTPIPIPTPIAGFLRDDMSVPSTLGSCGRGTRSLYPPAPILGYLRNDMSVPSTLGSCGRGTHTLHAPRASRTKALRKVLTALRVVIICYCLTLSVLTALPDRPDSRSLDDSSQCTGATSRMHGRDIDPPNQAPEPPVMPVEPSPSTRKVGKRGGPSGPHKDRWKEQRPRKWVRKID
ncbi:hypothetical protein FS749_013834 [Ceratobasidium sp. UAMH 11750]|nr:hypothetical protein FS749_013834 [Ceratobasidium sp. UAMH 11750]